MICNRIFVLIPGIIPSRMFYLSPGDLKFELSLSAPCFFTEFELHVYPSIGLSKFLHFLRVFKRSSVYFLFHKFFVQFFGPSVTNKDHNHLAVLTKIGHFLHSLESDVHFAYSRSLKVFT